MLRPIAGLQPRNFVQSEIDLEAIMNVRAWMVAAFFVSGAAAASGQATNSSDVSGTVSDISCAFVPDVTVTVTDLDKGLVRTYITNQSGLYDTGPITPEDNYTVEFSKQGYASLQRGPMALHVGVVGLNVQLNVGQATQQVVVNEAAPLLETTTAELSATLPIDTLQTLPQTG